MEFVSTEANVKEIAARIESGEHYELESQRRSGKTTLIQMLSRELKKRGVEHQIFVVTNEQAALYAAAGIGCAAKQGTALTAGVVILDEACRMESEFLASLRDVPSLIKIGTPTGVHKDALVQEAMGVASVVASR